MYLIFALNKICKKNDITEILLKVALNTMTLYRNTKNICQNMTNTFCCIYLNLTFINI